MPHAPTLTQALAQGAQRLAIADGSSLVLAVSGGPDSMALLHGAVALAAERNWSLVVAHLDHGLRPESAADAAFVTDASAALGLRSEIGRVDVGAMAAKQRIGVEEAGRRARYAFLDEVAAAADPEALIVTAHTADDQAETILLNLVRGAGLRGSRGMPARRGRVVRPLLGTRRADLRAALEREGIGFREDATNADVRRSRARIRHDVLPALVQINPGAVDALLRYGELAAEDDAFLDALAASELIRRRGEDGSLDWHEPPQRALARRVLRLAVGHPAPPAERIVALDEAARGPRGGLIVELGGGRRALVKERRIRLEAASSE
jgi:tRNA(Ile)-lysidine synthase